MTHDVASCHTSCMTRSSTAQIVARRTARNLAPVAYKVRAGLYRTSDHRYEVEQTFTPEGGVLGWELRGPDGDWMQTYRTKREALESVAY